MFIVCGLARRGAGKREDSTGTEGKGLICLTGPENSMGMNLD